MSDALHFLIVVVGGRLQRRLGAQIEYLIAENALDNSAWAEQFFDSPTPNAEDLR